MLAYSAFNHLKTNVVNDENIPPTKKKQSQPAVLSATKGGLKPRAALGDISNINNNNNNINRTLKPGEADKIKPLAAPAPPKRGSTKKSKTATPSLRPANLVAPAEYKEEIDWSQVPIDSCSKYLPVRQTTAPPKAPSNSGALELSLLLSNCATVDEMFLPDLKRSCTKAENFIFGDTQQCAKESGPSASLGSTHECMDYLGGLLTRYDREEETRKEKLFAQFMTEPVDEAELERMEATLMAEMDARWEALEQLPPMVFGECH